MSAPLMKLRFFTSGAQLEHLRNSIGQNESQLFTRTQDLRRYDAIDLKALEAAGVDSRLIAAREQEISAGRATALSDIATMKQILAVQYADLDAAVLEEAKANPAVKAEKGV